MGDLTVALIHDEFTRRGGAERVFEELLRLFPQADVFALYASNHPRIVVNDKTYPIHTSFLQQLPAWFRKHPRRVLPLLSQAAEQFDFSDYDLVISSASGFAKAVVTRSTIPHISYCHTPTRYLWETTHEAVETAPFGLRFPSRMLLHYLRIADFAAAQRPDHFIANSLYTQRRIASHYRRESTVIYPPIATSFFTPLHQSQLKPVHPRPFVIVGRLTPSKYVDHAIVVCEKLQLPLIVAGVGSDYARLKKNAGAYTRFVGKVSAEDLRTLYREARAFLQPGIEDFGMASVEALACGTPVIAYGQGGIQEIISSPAYGVLYNTQRPESLAEAIRQFMILEPRFETSRLQARALDFSTHHFHTRMKAEVESVLRKHVKSQ